jgi:hypothetical protein
MAWSPGGEVVTETEQRGLGLPRPGSELDLLPPVRDSYTWRRGLEVAMRPAWPPGRRDDLGRFAVVDTAGPGGGAGHEPTRSAEDVGEYVQRMRSLPCEQVIGDVVFSLLNAAQVKVGRRDARLLIDVAAVAHEHARPYLPGPLTTQIDQVLGQLRLGQVSAEGHASRSGEPEQNDLDRVPAPPPGGAAQPPADQASGKLRGR